MTMGDKKSPTRYLLRAEGAEGEGGLEAGGGRRRLGPGATRAGGGAAKMEIRGRG